MVGRQGEDSCRNSGTDETPQIASDEEAHRPPAESNSGRTSSPDYVSRLFVFKLDSCSYVLTSFSYFKLASITNILIIYY
ncbi:hypothetical protein [Priestia megaterium]|uniref:hypothetical protein n=1 Tax=Priestia megaterium TaxID=1404 RepID=UPI00101DF7B3